MSGKYRFGARAATSGYTQLPNVVLYDDALSAASRLLYAMLWDLATFAQDEPEQDELAAKMGCTAKTLRGYISELVKRGLVASVRRGRGQTNAYIVNVPDGRNDRSRTVETTDPTRAVEDEGQNAVTEASASVPGHRAANIVFDAVADATGENVTLAGGKIAKAVKAIRAAEAGEIRRHCEQFLAENPAYDEVPKQRIDDWLAAKIRLRAEQYAERRPEWELTATALATHWRRIPTWTPERRAAPTANELLEEVRRSPK